MITELLFPRALRHITKYDCADRVSPETPDSHRFPRIIKCEQALTREGVVNNNSELWITLLCSNPNCGRKRRGRRIELSRAGVLHCDHCGYPVDLSNEYVDDPLSRARIEKQRRHGPLPAADTWGDRKNKAPAPIVGNVGKLTFGADIDKMIADEVHRGRRFLPGSPKMRAHEERLLELRRLKDSISAKVQMAQKAAQPVSKSDFPARIEMDLTNWIPERAETTSTRTPEHAGASTNSDDAFDAQDDGETRRLRRLAQPAVTPSANLQRAVDLDLQAKLVAKATMQQRQEADAKEGSTVPIPCAQLKPAEAAPPTANSVTAQKKRAGVDLAGVLILGSVIIFSLGMFALAPMLLAPVLLLFVWWVCACISSACSDPHRRAAEQMPPPIVPVKRGQLTTPSQRARFLANQMSYDELVAAWKAEKRPRMKEYYQRQIDYLNDHKDEL